MGPVDPDELIDSSQVATILGLTHRHSVSTYRRRYPDFPRPAVTRGKGRTNLWLRTDIETWHPPGLNRTGSGDSAATRKRNAILDAAAELMAARPMAEISVREVAARAGVAHTLIYRLVGSKTDLERAVIDRTVNELLDFTTSGPEAAFGNLDWLVDTLMHRRNSVLVLLYSMFPVAGPARSTDRAPVMALFLDHLRADMAARQATGEPRAEPRLPPLTPEVAVGAVAALVMGWAALEPRIHAGTGIAETPTRELAALAVAILDLARTAQPPQELT